MQRICNKTVNHGSIQNVSWGRQTSEVGEVCTFLWVAVKADSQETEESNSNFPKARKVWNSAFVNCKPNFKGTFKLLFLLFRANIGGQLLFLNCCLPWKKIGIANGRNRGLMYCYQYINTKRYLTLNQLYVLPSMGFLRLLWCLFLCVCLWIIKIKVYTFPPSKISLEDS